MKIETLCVYDVRGRGENSVKIVPDAAEMRRSASYLKVELAELLLGVDVGVSRRDYRTGGERHLSIWRLAVIRGDGGQAAVVSELLVQDAGGGMARRRRLDLADVVQAQQERQHHDAKDEDAAGAATQYFVHDSFGATRVACKLHGRSRRFI